MNIAIIGAGFCGLAVAWHLLNQTAFQKSNIQLFDYKEIGTGTSGMAAGLLHPYSGAHAKLNWMGKEGMHETQKLLCVASQAFGKSVISQELGILRLALTHQQQEDYQYCAQLYSDEVKWLNAEECQLRIPTCALVPGLWIKHGLVVYSALYLKGLWLACQQQGARFEQRSITSLNELSHFDLVIITAGAFTRNFSELSLLPLTSVKGQMIELKWPSSQAPLSCALNSQAYLLMTPKKHSCLAGATYERGWTTLESQPAVAQAYILPKLEAMLPHLKGAPLIDCFSGLRAVTPNHLPLIFQSSSRHWILTGMGSKGLLYHALMAKQLVQNIQKTIF